MAKASRQLELSLDVVGGSWAEIAKDAAATAAYWSGFPKMAGKLNETFAKIDLQLSTGLLGSLTAMKDGFKEGLDKQKRFVDSLDELASRPAIIAKQVELDLVQQKHQQTIAGIRRTEEARQRGGGIGETIGGLVGQRGAQVGRVVGEATGGGAAALGTAFSAVAGPVGAVVSGFQQAANAVGSFVQKSNPAAMERFQVILDDVSGVIGQTLLPVIEVLSQAARLFGDVLASILPSADEMREALKPVSDFLEDLRDALAPIVPIIKDVLSVALKGLAEVLRQVLAPFRLLAQIIGALFGSEDAKPLKSSQGAAARNISFTNPEQFARSVNVAAFRGAAGQGEYHSPLDKIGGTLGKISGTVDNILTVMRFGKDALDPKGAAVGGGNAAGIAVKGIKGGLGGTVADMDSVYDRGGDTPPRVPEVRERGTADRGGGGNGALPAGIGAAIVEAIKQGLAGANGRDPLADHLDQSKRRGMDGHPGSA